MYASSSGGGNGSGSGSGGGGGGGNTNLTRTLASAATTALITSTTSSATLTNVAAIQKAKNKRTVLPKTSLIQLYLNSNVVEPAAVSLSASSSSSSPRTRLLPKFNQQDIIDKLKDAATQPVRKIVKEALSNHHVNNTNSSGSSNRRSSTTSSVKMSNNNNTTNLDVNESFCSSLVQNEEKTRRTMTTTTSTATPTTQTATPTMVMNSIDESQPSSRENLIRHLTKEFLLDCKQKLDSESFKKCLMILADANKSAVSIAMVFISSF